MEYCLTDVATIHQVTNQQPNDYKEPINKSQDKLRGYNNTVNKYMGSKMEKNFISQNQFTVSLALDTSQSQGRAGTYCTIYN
jgi:CRISPR/Cas system CMR-associated protein Cmr1 (group 7 of RAMP superfamily)